MASQTNQHEWTAHQKAGQITVFLVQGSKLSTGDVARLTGMTFMGAKYMMEMLSMVLPIEHRDKCWQWIQKSNV